MENNKQTAVEWLTEQLPIRILNAYQNEIEKAKAMEKEQIKNSFVECWKANVPDGVECKLDADQYYNEKYGREKENNKHAIQSGNWSDPATWSDGIS